MSHRPGPSSSRWYIYQSLLLLITIIHLYEVESKQVSGLYVDNGFDQTVVHRLKTKREKRVVEHEMLNLLGLPDRPPKRRGGNETTTQVNRSASKFLMDIYKNALDEDSIREPVAEALRKARASGKSEFDLSDQDFRAIDQSDAIMTFAAYSHHLPVSAGHARGKRLWFDVSGVPAHEHIINAELRLYRSAGNLKSVQNLGSFTLTAYRVQRLEDGERELRYINAMNVTGGQEGWIALNISEALRYWVQNPAGNRGLYLSVHQAGRSACETKPESIGIAGVKDGVERQPFMVGYFKSSGINDRKIRQKRDVDLRKKAESSWINPYTESRIRRPPKTCKKQSLYVNFRDLKWHDWIIAPAGYDIYYCNGVCDFPLNADMNATNHAIVQTLVHLLQPDRVPKPCCAPTELTGITVLYALTEGNVMLKKYEDTVVQSCGCQ